MKKELLLSVLMVMMPLMANAYDAEIDGIYYNFSGSEASVTYRDSQYANYSGSVTIPESVTYNGKTYSVTGINGWAFAYCSELNSITIPNSVTSIGDFAFNMCRVLSSVVIPNGVKSIGYQTFGHCLALTSVIIPNSVTSIGTRAFDNCGNLQSATIPTSVTEIGERAFEGCKSLTSVTIPEGVRNISDRSFFGCTSLASLIIGNGVTSIGVSAFAGCQLTSLVIPNSVTSIGDFAFANCSELATVTFPNGVTSIGHQAFEACVNLSSLTIPSSVTFIANDAFFGCSGLTSFVIDKGNTIYDSRDNCNAIIETDSNTLIWGCMNTTIPSSVTTIGNYAFHGCEGLTSANIPEGVTTIGEGAFQNCNNLTTITIPRSVTVIKDYAFDVFGKLNDVYCYAEEVPNTSIEAFYALTTGFSNPYFAVESATLHVPAVSIDKYKATEPWQYFGNIVTTASDIQHSGCLSRTRASSKSTTQSISLLKEGNILTVNLRNFWSTCDTQDFEVTPSVSDGNNSDPYTVSVRVKPIGEDIADCICPYNISFTIHDVEANSFQFKCWWFNGQVNLTEGEPWVMSNEYYPEGTKWTEIRLDTLKYDSWYSKVDDEWVPNFETVEYSVKGEYTPKYWEVPFKCVYTNSQECTDSLALLIYEGRDYGYDMGVLATVPLLFDDNTTPYPGEAYFFDWGVGMTLRFVDILSNNTTAIYPPGTFDFGKIEEIKEGNFGGVRPLKYTDVNGVRIIRGIGVTTWNDGECIFGPVKPYRALSFFNEDFPHKERHYRSMLVHFERNGEVLYNVWPGTPDDMVTFTEGQMATIILPTTPDASKGKYYRLDRREDDKVIFEEELHPQAHVPYIIVPKEDFNIDLNTLDLKGCLRDTVSIKGISFIGSYIREELENQEGFYIDIIDLTPDCRRADTSMEKSIIGPLRAYLSWNDPYSQGPTKGVRIVLHDNPNGIAEMKNERVKSEKYDNTIYDLQGRKIYSQSSILNSQLPKGLYIVNGKKVVVK